MTTTSDFEHMMQSLKNEFQTVTFDFIKQAICVNILGFWEVIAVRNASCEWTMDENIRTLVRNYVIFQKLEAEILETDPSTRGGYLLVNSNDSRFFCETMDSAYRKMSGPYSFIGRIGVDNDSEEILALSAVDKSGGIRRIR